METELCLPGGDGVCVNETATPRLVRSVRWWPLLLGPLAMTWVYAANMAGLEEFASRWANENIALYLLAVPMIAFSIQTFSFRSEFTFFMAALCAAFFCREWHFAGTSTGIYVALGLLAFWALKRKTSLEAIIGNGHTKVWLWSTFSVYVLSQLIARRVFRYVYLPGEAELHVPLEESVETMAHVMMIATCVIGWGAIAAARHRQAQGSAG